MAALRLPASEAGLLRAKPRGPVAVRHSRLKVGRQAGPSPAQSFAAGGGLAEVLSLTDFGAYTSEPVVATSTENPIVILPGFCNSSVDYEAPFGVQRGSLASHLRDRGFKTWTVPVRRQDWLKVSRGVASAAYWRGRALPALSYGWYLRLVQATVDLARQQTGSEQVTLVGHSAGGWLARAFVADPLYFDSPAAEPGCPHAGVAAIVTLGSPNLPLPLGQGHDVTGGALRHVHTSYPGSFFDTHGVQYICVSGRSVRGDQRAHRSSLERYSFYSYKQVCGQGQDVDGDAVVPNCSAFLQGAHNLLVEGCHHSMAKIGSFTAPSEHLWYGSTGIVDAWLDRLVRVSPSSPCAR